MLTTHRHAIGATFPAADRNRRFRETAFARAARNTSFSATPNAAGSSGSFAGVGAVVNQPFRAHGDWLRCEHRKIILLVVIAGVVTMRAFQRGFIGVDRAFEHNFCSRRHLQIIADTFHQLRARATQQAGKLISLEVWAPA